MSNTESDKPYSADEKFSEGAVVIFEPKQEIVSLPDNFPCDCAIYEKENKKLGILFASNNNAAGFVPFKSAGGLGEQAKMVWQLEIIEMNLMAQNDNRTFNSVEWLNNELERYSNTLGTYLYPTERKMTYENIRLYAKIN
jgi:hypothetical protein